MRKTISIALIFLLLTTPAFAAQTLTYVKNGERTGWILGGAGAEGKPGEEIGTISTNFNFEGSLGVHPCLAKYNPATGNFSINTIQKDKENAEKLARTNLEQERLQTEQEFKTHAFRRITPAQAETYIDNNVTDLASAKIVMKKMARAIIYLLKQTELDVGD